MAGSFGYPDNAPNKYKGITENLVPMFFFCRRPTTTDKKYRIGSMVLLCGDPPVGNAGELWYLREFVSGEAQWYQIDVGGASPGIDSILTDDGAPAVGPDSTGQITLQGGTGIVTSGQDPSTTIMIELDTNIVTTEYDADTGTAVPSAGQINIVGGTGIDTSASGSTVTISWNSSVTAQTYHTDSGDVNPSAGAITVTGGTGLSTSGSGSTLTINLDTSLVTTSYAADSGTAAPSSGVITFAGGTGITTSASGSTVTIDSSADVATSYAGDSGTATPAANVLTIAGGSGITTSATGSTVTIAVSSPAAITFTEDTGSATPSASNINIFGGTGITTSGSGATVTIAVDTSAVATSYAGDSGTAAPSAGVLTLAGGTGLTTSASGSTVTFDVDTSVVTTSYAADSGTAAPSAGVTTIAGGTGITTSASGSTITITASTAASTLTGDDAVAESPVSGNWDILGETVANASHAKPIYTVGSAGTITIDAQVGAAITGAPADKNDAGLVSFDDTMFACDSNGYVTLEGGTNGQVPIASTGNAAQFASITSTDGSITWTAGSNTLDASCNIISSANTGSYNLGISLSSGTFTINSRDGSSLSSSNSAYISMPSSTYGRSKIYTITANQSFNDASSGGGSDIAGNLFNVTTGVAESNDVPFYIYAVSDSTETTIAFGISRIPNLQVTPSASYLGSPSSATASYQMSIFFFNSVTLANYASRPCICLGAFRMTKDSSDDWTVSTLSQYDGIGQFLENKTFTWGAGLYGNYSGKYTTLSDLTFTNNFPQYNMSKNGIVDITVNLNSVSSLGSYGQVTIDLPFQNLYSSWSYTITYGSGLYYINYPSSSSVYQPINAVMFNGRPSYTSSAGARVKIATPGATSYLNENSMHTGDHINFTISFAVLNYYA